MKLDIFFCPLEPDSGLLLLLIKIKVKYTFWHLLKSKWVVCIDFYSASLTQSTSHILERLADLPLRKAGGLSLIDFTAVLVVSSALLAFAHIFCRLKTINFY